MKTLILALLFALALCAGSTLAQQPPPPASPDEAAVREIVRRYVSARELKDPGAVEALFTADADQHTTSGEWRRGRDRVVAGTSESSARNPGTRRITIETVRFITPEVAIADGPYEIASAGGAVRRNWTTFVLRREAAGWRIAAIRNMAPTGAQ